MNETRAVAIESDAAAAPDAGAPRRIGRAGAVTALILLSLANAFNLADRMLIGVVQEAVRAEFHLSDFQLGLLGGSAFAVLYALLSVPIARLADRHNRIAIITVALGLWSGMTALCGLAGNFVQMLFARAGVSIGEAGGVAPALSYFADIFSPRRRATAMAFFAIGGPAGALLSTIAGAWLTQAWGWRAAFIGFGVAGLLLALTIRLALREVRTGRNAAAPVSLPGALRALLRKRSYLHVCGAGIFAAFCATFILQYMTSFLIRAHGLPLTRAALVTGLAGGVFGMAGAFSGGWLADRVAARRPGARTLVLTATFSFASLALSLAWWLPLELAIPLLLVGTMALNAYPGISFAVSSMTAPAHLRATAIAMFTVAGNLLGYALGPPLLGAISDGAAAMLMTRQGIAPATCAAVSATMPGATVAACALAQANALRIALTVASLLLICAALHHWRASRTLAADIEE